jgi:hypothetical protein
VHKNLNYLSFKCKNLNYKKPDSKNLNIDNFRLKMLEYKYFSRSQFHQHSIRTFYVRKCFAQLFSSYILALEFLSPNFCTKNPHVKHLWNWWQEELQQWKVIEIRKSNPTHHTTDTSRYFCSWNPHPSPILN